MDHLQRILIHCRKTKPKSYKSAPSGRAFSSQMPRQLRMSHQLRRIHKTQTFRRLLRLRFELVFATALYLISSNSRARAQWKRVKRNKFLILLQE